VSACERIMLQIAPSSCWENVALCQQPGYRGARRDAVRSGILMHLKQPVPDADRNREVAP
jgi:hypothetical protein